MLLGCGVGCWKLMGLIDICAEKPDAIYRNTPVIRHLYFAAAHDGGSVDCGGVTFNTGLTEINFGGAHHPHHAAAAEILSCEAALESAKDCNLIEVASR